MGRSDAWWARGIALAERLPVVPAGAAPHSTARKRLHAWREAHGLAASGQFAVRLAAAGITEDGLLSLLAEPPAALAARVRRPAWATVVEVGSPPDPVAVPEHWLDAFALPFQPWVRAAAAQLTSATPDLPELQQADVAAGFATALGRTLSRLAARTLVRELHLARPGLPGETAQERYAAFLGSVSLDSLKQSHPVLVRLVAEACRRAVAARVELFERFAADRDLVVEKLCDGEPGPVAEIADGAGDTHRDGRSVTMIRFADGATVVYKPRRLDLDLRLARLIEAFNDAVPGLELRHVDTLARDGYGWQRFVTPSPCADENGITRFYTRLGALLALLHVVNACDVHQENLIADGDMPMLVDAETLFHPHMPMPGLGGDPAASVLRESVQRVGLLPTLLVGDSSAVDLSGLGGGAGGISSLDVLTVEAPGTDQMRLIRAPVPIAQAGNRPRLAGVLGDPSDYKAAICDGFRTAYRAIAKHRTAFEELVSAAGSDEIRIVARPTRAYARLLTESTHPDVLGDALDRDRMFDLLWLMSLGDPVRVRLVPAEIADLWAGDVPLFSGRAGGRDVLTSTGVRLPGILAQSGVDAALHKLATLSEHDLRTQEWIVLATLATRQPAADPRRCLDAACEVAADIADRVLADGDTVGWIGLQLVDERHWLVLPAGAGLADGYCGIALFLAELASLTGDESHARLARRAVQRLPQLLDALAVRPDLVAAIGPGELHGLSGTVRRLSVLLDAPYLHAAAEHASLLAGPVPDRPDDLRAADERLRDRARRFLDGGPASATPEHIPTPGLYHGLAGTGFGLLRLGFPDRVPPLTALRSNDVHTG